MAIISNLVAMLTANTSRFESGMKQAQRTTKQTQGVFVDLGRTLKQNLGFLSSGALLLAFKNTINSMDEMAKAADRIGVSTESLSKMAYVGSLADVSMDDLERTIKKMQQTLVETPKAFDSLGLSVKNMIDLAPDEQLLQIVDALLKIENPAIRNARALDIFGKAGLKMINFAQGGSKSIKELYQEAERLGLVLKDSTARSAERLNDNLERLKQSINGVFIQASDSGALDVMAEGLTTILNLIVQVTNAYGELLRALGADIGPGDVIKRTQQEAEMKMKVQGAFLESLKRQPASPMRDNAIAKTTAEIERLEQVAANSAKYFDESGNLVNPAPAKKGPKTPWQDPDELKKTSKELADRERELGRIYEQTRTPLERYNAELERLASLRKDLGEDTYARAIDQAGKEYEDATKKAGDLNDIGEELGMTFSSAFEDAIVEGKKFGDVMRGLGQDIIRIFTRMMITEPLAASLKGVFNGGGGGASGLFDSISGGVGDFFGDVFSGLGFAKGGRPPMGKLSVVGERGPELWAPDSAGTIIPNDMLGNGGNTYQIDARGTDASVVRRLEQSLLSLAGPGVVEARVNDAMQRGVI